MSNKMTLETAIKVIEKNARQKVKKKIRACQTAWENLQSSVSKVDTRLVEAKVYGRALACCAPRIKLASGPRGTLNERTTLWRELNAAQLPRVEKQTAAGPVVVRSIRYAHWRRKRRAALCFPECQNLPRRCVHGTH